MSKLLGIVGSLSQPSKTRTAVEVALEAAARAYDVETEVLHLAEYDLATADGRKMKAYTGDTAKALEKIVGSTAYLIGTPVYRAAYSGVLKNLLDLVPRGMWQADVAPFENSAVGLIATGATAHHYLAVEKELGPVLAFFGAHLVGSGVYAYGEHFEGSDLVDGAVRGRLETLGKATVELSRAITGSEHLASLGPQF